MRTKKVGYDPRFLRYFGDELEKLRRHNQMNLNAVRSVTRKRHSAGLDGSLFERLTAFETKIQHSLILNI